ncbi:MAG: hypothetical protein AAGH76_00530 [Pseudomonadota bacterium]
MTLACLVSLAMLLPPYNCPSPDAVPVYRGNSAELSSVTSKFKYSVEDAQQLLVENMLIEYPQATLSPFHLVVGTEYFFAKSSHNYRRTLDGYYVDGQSGRVVYRVAKDELRSRKYIVMSDVFAKEIVVREGDK